MTEYEIFRRLVEQKISLTINEGGWEGSHLDYKLMLKDDHNSISKTLKHILAFANTPRKSEAFIIFGVRENKDDKRFIHEGASRFPEADKINNCIQAYTNLSLNDLIIDNQFELNGKLTPYIIIHQVYDGPYYAIKNYKKIQKNIIYTRYGRSSIEASKRDRERMMEWDKWSIDIRYALNNNSLVEILRTYFNNIESIYVEDEYVRFIYTHTYDDEFGNYDKKFLVHAYSGVYPIKQVACERILKDHMPNTDKCIIGPQFSNNLLNIAKKENIRLIDFDKVYFKNDPYAKYCKAYLRYWKNNCDKLQITKVIDLDYKKDGIRNESIITYLDRILKSHDESTTVVIGDFGTGKSVTAKYLTSELVKDYLRKAADSKKVIYLDLNNYDLRAKVQDILRVELEVNCRLKSEDADRLLEMFEENKINIIYDSVDEMAKPYSKEGRKQVIESLRQIGNKTSSIYFVRSTYFKTLNELKEMFKKLSYSAKVDDYSLNINEICDLDEKQIKDLFFSRLDADIAVNILSQITKKDYKKILRDPLIVSLICNYIDEVISQTLESEDENKINLGKNIILQFFEDSPTTGRISFLSYLLSGLLEREQVKRKKHKAADYFDTFIGFLNEIAFIMVCEGSNRIPMQRWNELISINLTRKGIEKFNEEAIGAFRTMAWVKRDDKMNMVLFRNELLSLICAAKFIILAIKSLGKDNYRKKLLEEWDNEAENAEIVLRYTASLLSNDDVIEIALQLESKPTSTIEKMLLNIIEQFDFNGIYSVEKANLNDSIILAKLGNCIVEYPATGLTLIKLLYNNMKTSRFASLLFPLLVKINDRYFDEKNEKLLYTAYYLVKSTYEINKEWGLQSNSLKDQVGYIKKAFREYFDKLLLRHMGISQKAVLTSEHYKEIYNAIDKNIDAQEWEKKHIRKSIAWINSNAPDDLYKVR